MASSYDKLRQDSLIIGLDFGTTFTGVAFCYSNTPDDTEVIRTWPGGNLIASEKVPTEFSYEGGFQWGCQIKPTQKRVQCIKLLLDKSKDVPAFAFKDDAIKELKQYDKTVVDAVADYLTEIYKHTMTTLTQRFSETLVKNTPMQVVLTVPAVWSDVAKHATLTAAYKAGMGDDLKIISEPEAAACYTMKAIQPNHLQVGNNMVVCDAGGGTVDLITYRITKLVPLELEESSVGTGGLCGAAFLNMRFEEVVMNRLGKEAFAKMIDKKPKTWHTALKYFEDYVKRNLNSEEEEFNVPFPGIPDDEKAGIDSGFMVLTSEEVREIFDPIVKEIIQLIQGQVTAVRKANGTVSAILLVGGFGQSMYLYERVQDYFKDGSPPPYAPSIRDRMRNMYLTKPSSQNEGHMQAITVMQPPNAWTAVVRGAVLRGLEGTIVTDRRSRYDYGVTYGASFMQGTHPEWSRYWDRYDERYRARNTMQWYVYKNDKVSERRAVTFSFYHGVDGEEPPETVKPITTVLLASDADTAPLMYDPQNMYTICTLVTDVEKVPKHCWRKHRTSNGSPFLKLNYSIVMRIDSARLDFSLKVDGVEYGMVKASFDT